MQNGWPIWITTAEVAATLLLIVKLAASRLYAVYPCFFSFLVVDAASTSAGLIFRAHRRLYAEIYFASQGAKMLLAVLVVLEIYRIALAGQPALARYGRNAVGYILACAALIAAAGSWIDRDTHPGRPALVRHFISLERTMDAWMLVFLLMIGIFMSWFPVRLKRNAFWYIGGFTLYFLTRSTGLLLSNVVPGLVSRLDNMMIATQIFCLLLWFAVLRPAGEKGTTTVGHRWDAVAAGRLQSQLNAINAALLRFSRH